MINYLENVSVKFSKGKGRGIFADKSIKKGDLILVDKTIVSVKNDVGNEKGNIELQLDNSGKLQDTAHN